MGQKGQKVCSVRKMDQVLSFKGHILTATLDAMLKAEQIGFGEECSMRYVQNTLAAAIDHYNEVVAMIKEKSPADLLQLCDEAAASDDPEAELEEIAKRIEHDLVPVAVKSTHDNFRTLVLDCVPLLVPQFMHMAFKYMVPHLKFKNIQVVYTWIANIPAN